MTPYVHCRGCQRVIEKPETVDSPCPICGTRQPSAHFVGSHPEFPEDGELHPLEERRRYG